MSWFRLISSIDTIIYLPPSKFRSVVPGQRVPADGERNRIRAVVHLAFAGQRAERVCSGEPHAVIGHRIIPGVGKGEHIVVVPGVEPVADDLLHHDLADDVALDEPGQVGFDHRRRERNKRPE